MAADIYKFYIFRWLEHMGELVDEDITKDSNITWAAYHASEQAEPDFIPAVSYSEKAWACDQNGITQRGRLADGDMTTSP